jgi:hypothetical protein
MVDDAGGDPPGPSRERQRAIVPGWPPSWAAKSPTESPLLFSRSTRACQFARTFAVTFAIAYPWTQPSPATSLLVPTQFPERIRVTDLSGHSGGYTSAEHQARRRIVVQPVELQPLDVDRPQHGGIEDLLATRLEEPVEVAGNRRIVEVVGLDAGIEQQHELPRVAPQNIVGLRGGRGTSARRSPQRLTAVFRQAPSATFPSRGLFPRTTTKHDADSVAPVVISRSWMTQAGWTCGPGRQQSVSLRASSAPHSRGSGARAGASASPPPSPGKPGEDAGDDSGLATTPGTAAADT